MPVLELVVDASQMQRGADQASAALKGVQTAADNTQRSVTAMGSGLRNTFQAVGGVSQVGQGISQTARAFGELNIAMAAFSASRTLLEISKTTQDFREMAAGVTRGATAWSTLGLVLRAHPILTIATVLGAAASLMSIFTSNTREAATATEGLATSMQKLRLDQATARFLGDTPGGSRDEMTRLFSLTSQLLNQGPGTLTRPNTYSLADVQEMVGAPSRGGLATQLGVSNYDRSVPGFENFDLGAVQIRQEDVLNWVRSRYQSLRATSAPSYGGRVAGPGESLPEYQELARMNEEASRQIAENMRRAAEYSAQIGGALGAGVWDVLAGIQGWRQMIASIINSFGRQSLSDLGSAAASALFRPTTQQTVQNIPAGNGGMIGDPGSFG